jgi:hypothetical protein
MEIWKALERMQRNGAITGFLPGEDFRRSHEAGWKLAKRFKELQGDRDFGRNNRGITIVIL